MKIITKTLLTIVIIIVMVVVGSVTANQECQMADLVRGLHLAKEMVSAPTPTPVIVIVNGSPLGNCSMPIDEWFKGGYLLGDSWQVRKINDYCSEFRCPRLVGTLDKRFMLPIGVYCKDSLGNYNVPLTIPPRDNSDNRNELKTICRKCGI